MQANLHCLYNHKTAILDLIKLILRLKALNDYKNSEDLCSLL